MLKRGGKIVFWVMLLLFAAALARIVSLRLGSGDIYPEYSSLRADPLGTKAFYESLERLQDRSVTRHLHPLNRIRGEKDQTVLLFGSNPSSTLNYAVFEQIERIARNGGRVVVAVNATGSWKEDREEDRINKQKLPLPEKEKKEEGNEGEEEEDGPKIAGARAPIIALIDPLRLEQEELTAERVTDDAELPEEITWYGRYCFKDLADEWETVLEVKGKPVVIEREIGLGRLVLCADSFPFSNEALAHDRSLQFLLWTIGPAEKIVFDESHLGVHHGNSIMLLLREFRLQGLFYGFLLVAGLWIWRSSVSFVPPYVDAGTAEIVEGKTAREGVVHLLERNLPTDELPQVCLAEWRRSHPNLNSFDAARYAEAEAVVRRYSEQPRKERDPIQTYGEITKILSK
jgi:hypothetical protein